MSEVISFRLELKNPREAQALALLACYQERGYSTRRSLTEALLKLGQTDSGHDLQAQTGEILSTLNQVGDQIEQLQKSGMRRMAADEEKQAVLSDAFVLSVKSAAKHGIV